jgi:hypothetical protein
VREVNKPDTRCADGSWQPECHPGIVYVSALALSDEDRVRFDQAFGLSHALARGVLHLCTATATPADELVDRAGAAIDRIGVESEHRAPRDHTSQDLLSLDERERSHIAAPDSKSVKATKTGSPPRPNMRS